MTKHGILFCALALASAPAFAGGQSASADPAKDKSAKHEQMSGSQASMGGGSAGGSQAGMQAQAGAGGLPPFSEVDTDNSGSISQDEYASISVGGGAAMGGGTAMGGGMADEQPEFAEVDVDASGTIDRQEAEEAGIVDMFEQADADANAELTEEEYDAGLGVSVGAGTTEDGMLEESADEGLVE